MGQEPTNASGLTEKQNKLINFILQGMSIPEASLAAGYSHSTSGYQAVASSAVQKALHRRRQRLIVVEGATLGWRTMVDLCAEGIPAGTRYNAAKTLMLMGGHSEGGGDEDEDNTPLHEMTMDQLRRFIARVRAEVEAGGDPPVIKLVEGDNAQPGHNPDQ